MVDAVTQGVGRASAVVVEGGYQLGLRGFDIATGCGAGAMKGPMKGATIGHAKQLNHSSRFVGISEPGIIAAESPNPLVNELVILPDIEKRLEAFLRLAHAVVVFPGGAGTAEELFYLLGVKMHPANAELPLPVVLAAPASSAAYFELVDRRVADIGESRLSGMQTIGDFMQRRLTPARSTCATTSACSSRWSSASSCSLARAAVSG